MKIRELKGLCRLCEAPKSLRKCKAGIPKNAYIYAEGYWLYFMNNYLIARVPMHWCQHAKGKVSAWAVYEGVKTVSPSSQVMFSSGAYEENGFCGISFSGCQFSFIESDMSLSRYFDGTGFQTTPKPDCFTPDLLSQAFGAAALFSDRVKIETVHGGLMLTTFDHKGATFECFVIGRVYKG